MLSSPVRYSVYVAGAILLLIVALGVGATAAAVVGWQSERRTAGDAGSNPAKTSPPERGKQGSTSTDDALEKAGIKSSDERGDEGDGTMFIHQATDKNSRGDYTAMTNPGLDGDPDAVVLASVGTDREDQGAVAYAHNIGVWYASAADKWAIYNQDLAPVPAGSTFEVVVPDASSSFVHVADRSNSAGSYTYLDSRLTNGKPDVVLQVTQNWNPGGGNGVYNDHAVGVIYDPTLEEWAIYNLDGKPLPRGAAFNVAVSEDTN